MPILVSKRTDTNKGYWGVNWIWLPHFLCEDQLLRRHVDKRLTELFKGTTKPDDLMLMEISEAVVQIICERYPMKGLKAALLALVAVTPERRPEEEENEAGGVEVPVREGQYPKSVV